MPLLTREAVPGLLATGASARVAADVAPKFQVGQFVRIRNINPTGHTRLPRYVRGRRGVIERDHGVFVFPDTMAHGGGETPQHVYSVRFSFRELWGEGYAETSFLYIDMFDAYMEPAE